MENLLEFMSPSLCFSENLSERIRTSSCHFVVTGANGWLGKATLEMLQQALGDGFLMRVTALGSRQVYSNLSGGIIFPIQALMEWEPPRGENLIIFHYAFLTKDKVNDISREEYIKRNELLSNVVRAWIGKGNVRGMIMPSSGAVYNYLYKKAIDQAALLYGQLKYNDELAFCEACEAHATDLVIPRIFNLSGPYINKFDSYALASFIFQILSSKPVIIRARHPVIRSYYFIGDLIELCLQLLFKKNNLEKIECFDVAGKEVVELDELYERVSTVLSDRAPTASQRLPILDDAIEDRYVGNRNRIEKLEMCSGILPMPLEAQIFETSKYIETTIITQTW